MSMVFVKPCRMVGETTVRLFFGKNFLIFSKNEWNIKNWRESKKEDLHFIHEYCKRKYYIQRTNLEKNWFSHGSQSPNVENMRKTTCLSRCVRSLYSRVHADKINAKSRDVHEHDAIELLSGRNSGNVIELSRFVLKWTILIGE